jgi:hemoglobin/transferrin/lactoferrin receptor protein
MRRLSLLFNGALSSASALALLVAAEGAAAQDAGEASKPAPAQAAQQGSAINLDTITVTVTKTEESVVDTMAGASVVTGRQIERQMPSSVSQMLENVPGVASQTTPNDPGQSISIRGLQDFGRVNVLVDGARQDYQISGHNANGSFYLAPEFIGQADVVRGPVSNIYGSGAIGGVVSFRTRGVEDILRPDEKFGIEQRTMLGTNGAGLVTSTSAGARAGTAADVYGQLVYRNSSSYRDGSGAVVPDTGSDLLGGLFKLNVRPTDSQQITATAMQQKFNFINNGTSTDGARFKDDVTTGNYTLGYTFRPSWTPLVDFGAKVYYSTTQNRQTYLAPDADGVYSALGVMPGAPLSDTIDTYGFDVHNTSRFATGAFNHALTIGGDGVVDKVHTADDAGGYISVLTPSGQRTLSGAFVQDEVGYGGWLRALGRCASINTACRAAASVRAASTSRPN